MGLLLSLDLGQLYDFLLQVFLRVLLVLPHQLDSFLSQKFLEDEHLSLEYVSSVGLLGSHRLGKLMAIQHLAAPPLVLLNHRIFLLDQPLDLVRQAAAERHRTRRPATADVWVAV